MVPRRRGCFKNIAAGGPLYMTQVEEFILEQPENIQLLLKKLRFLILNSAPQIEERIVYGIPFFHLKKRIFYLTLKKERVDLGFCEGYLLSEHSILEIKGRSHVRTISYFSHEEIDEDILTPILQEAIQVHKK